MHILISGGTGFFGPDLSELMLNEAKEVICLDSFFTSSKKNIKWLFDNHRFEQIRHDFTQPILLEVDRIYNFACPASPDYNSQRQPGINLAKEKLGWETAIGGDARLQRTIDYFATLLTEGYS